MTTSETRYRPAQTFAWIATGLLAVGILLEIAEFVGDVTLVALLQGAEHSAPQQRLNDNSEEITLVGGVELLSGLLALVSLPIFVATVVFFLLWLYRAYSNLRPLGATGLEFTPRSAVGWYFVPFANLVKPYQAMSELWHASRPGPTASPFGTFESNRSALLSIWWGLWIVSNILDNIKGRLAWRSETDADLLFESWIGIAAAPLGVAAAVAAILVIRGIERRQRERHEARLRETAYDPASGIVGAWPPPGM